MRLGAIDFPDELISAHKDGRLVIFVGSGASRGAPSSLPTFDGLVRLITASTYDRNVDGPEDQYLGRRAKAGAKVHAKAKEILGEKSSQPNHLHELLVQLSLGGGPIRIVTTNYDRHLSTAISRVHGVAPDTFYAPALPLGSKFTGMVYLHGSVDRDDDSIVLTDEDFGRAYLTDGWATRFLIGLFQTYTVLFVGYSHNDVIVSYLARGLPPHAKPRFALVDQKDSRWDFLGIVPIVYPPGTDHTELSKGLEEWIQLAKMGTLEHEQRIRRIVSSPPPLDPQEADYIRGTLEDPVKLQFFTRYASSEEWLQWTEQQEVFKWLFRAELGPIVDPERPITYTAAHLASWFAEKFALTMPDRALMTIRKQGRQIQAMLWNEIAARLCSAKPPPSSQLLAKWAGVLVPPPAGHMRTWLWGLLARCEPSADQATPITLFDHLTVPRLVLRERLAKLDAEPAVDWDVVVLGTPDLVSVSIRAATGHELAEAWNNIFRPNLTLFAEKVVPLLTSRLRQAHLLFRSVERGDQAWDPFSIRYQNFEQRDGTFWDFAPIVDAARDVILWLLQNNRTRAEHIIEEWIYSEVPLLKRLATYALGKHDGWSANQKLTWLLKAGVIYGVTPDREVMQLLQSQYPAASIETRELIVSRLMDAPQTLGEKGRSHLSYAMLSRLFVFAPDCEVLKNRVTTILAQYPEFERREKPTVEEDLLTPAGSVAGVEQRAEVEKLLKQDPEKNVEELLTYVGER